METKIVLADEKESELAGQGRAIVAEAATYAIVRDDPHRDQALAFGRRVKAMRSMVGELFDDPIDQAFKLHRSLTGRRNALDNPLKEAEQSVKRGVGTYEDAKRAVVEAQRRAEEAARRAEVERLEAIRRAEIAAAQKAAEDKRLAEAAMLEAAGRKAEAEAVIAAPVHVVVAPIVQPIIPDRTPAYQAPKGVATTVRWKARIVNADIIPREWLIPNETAINAHVRAQGERHGIPGVEAYSEASASLR